MHNKTLLKQYYLVLGTPLPWMYEDYQSKEHWPSIQQMYQCMLDNH
jgi:hypothetical protein